jgi:cytochrome c oxidase subunit 2
MTTKVSSSQQSMHIDPYEKTWMVISVVLIVVFGIAIFIAGYAMGFQVPAPEQKVDPNTVAKEGPFANPGLRELAPGRYEVYVLAKIWSFTPNEITVPVGSKVTFYVTSVDVQHGFKILDTNISMQIVPGQVSKLTHTFDKAGEYKFICTEYCGAAHAAMFGKVIVTP